MDESINYWSLPVDELLEALASDRQGQDCEAARRRLQQYGRNTPAAEQGRSGALRLFLDQLRSPLVLILIFAAAEVVPGDVVRLARRALRGSADVRNGGAC